MAEEKETPKTAPSGEETPKVETPVTDTAKADAPKAEAPVEKAPKAKADAPAAKEEAPAADAPAAEGAEGAEGAKEEPETAADLLKDEVGLIKVRKAKGSKNISVGVVHIVATFNNTIVSITDPKGNLISWSSGGKMNFRGSRKSTAYAAQIVAQDAARL